MENSVIIIKSSNTWPEKTAKGTVLTKQQAAMDQGRDYPLPFELTVDQPYPPGKYVIAPQSFRVNNFNSLELNPYGLVLEPLKAV